MFKTEDLQWQVQVEYYWGRAESTLKMMCKDHVRPYVSERLVEVFQAAIDKCARKPHKPIAPELLEATGELRTPSAYCIGHDGKPVFGDRKPWTSGRR